MRLHCKMKILQRTITGLTGRAGTGLTLVMAIRTDPGTLGKTMCTTMIGFMTLSPTTGGQATIILTEIMRKRSWEARWGFTIGGQKLETDATGRNILDPPTIIIM